jgi:hypothetical protein
MHPWMIEQLAREHRRDLLAEAARRGTRRSRGRGWRLFSIIRRAPRPPSVRRPVAPATVSPGLATSTAAGHPTSIWATTTIGGVTLSPAVAARTNAVGGLGMPPSVTTARRIGLNPQAGAPSSQATAAAPGSQTSAPGSQATAA